MQGPPFTTLEKTSCINSGVSKLPTLLLFCREVDFLKVKTPKTFELGQLSIFVPNRKKLSRNSVGAIF